MTAGTLPVRDGLAILSPDGRLLTQADYHGSTVTLHEVVTGQTVGQLNAQGWHLIRQSFSPDNRLLAQGTEQGAILLWDVVRGELLTVWKGHRGSPYYLAWSPDGRRLTSSSADTTILVWTRSRGFTRPTG
jgi:WD40 repeat protein